jgi:hypothetical protein
VASLWVKSLAMTAKTDRRWSPRRRGAGSDAPRRPSDDTSDVAARLVKASRLARSRRRRDDRRSLPRWAQQPAEGPRQPARAGQSGDGASMSAAIAGVWVAAGARSTPRLE